MNLKTQLIAYLAASSDLLINAMEQHVYDIANGDKVPPDSPYLGAIHEAERLRHALETSELLRVIVCVSGGNVQGVKGTGIVHVDVLDYDNLHACEEVLDLGTAEIDEVTRDQAVSELESYREMEREYAAMPHDLY